MSARSVIAIDLDAVEIRPILEQAHFAVAAAAFAVRYPAKLAIRYRGANLAGSAFIAHACASPAIIAARRTHHISGSAYRTTVITKTALAYDAVSASAIQARDRRVAVAAAAFAVSVRANRAP